jgi:hypothetical protein
MIDDGVDIYRRVYPVSPWTNKPKAIIEKFLKSLGIKVKIRREMIA